MACRTHPREPHLRLLNHLCGIFLVGRAIRLRRTASSPSNHKVNVIKSPGAVIRLTKGRHMATATRTTGRAQQASGKNLARTRATSQIFRSCNCVVSARRLIDRNVTMLQAVLIDNSRRSPAKINRQPRRLEIRVTHTKQTPATQFNRQRFATWQITNHESQITSHARSNRHTSRLENAVSHRKQTLASRSNRRKSAFPASPISGFLPSHSGGFADHESWSQFTDHHSRPTPPMIYSSRAQTPWSSKQ
jgi:hypothetical protein